MENISRYDPTRKTVGAIYRDAQMNGERTPISVGDMRNELLSSLVEDLNDELFDFPKQKEYAQFENRPYYVLVHENRDLQMRHAFKRRIFRSLYRPWPEDDTFCFWRSPDRNEIKFCWEIPHWSEIKNILANENLYTQDEISRKRLKTCKFFDNYDLHHFGFMKDPIGNWIPNPQWKDEFLMKRLHQSTQLQVPA